MTEYQIKNKEQQLDFETKKFSFERIGWEFKMRVDISYHNGDERDIWSFKSPRMREFKDTYSIGGYDWKFEIEKLKEDEAYQCAVNHLKDNNFDGFIHNMQEEATKYLKELYKKDKTVRMDSRITVTRTVERM